MGGWMEMGMGTISTATPATYSALAYDGNKPSKPHQINRKRSNASKRATKFLCRVEIVKTLHNLEILPTHDAGADCMIWHQTNTSECNHQI
jgi:hypothetical protein